MDWDFYSKEILKINDIDSHKTDHAVVLATIFEGFLYPDISVMSKGSKLVYVPEQYYIKADGSNKIFDILKNSTIFHSMPIDIKLSFLDILYLTLHRSVYDVIRLQCWKYFNSDPVNDVDSNSRSLMRSLIDLLQIEIVDGSDSPIPVYLSKRIIRLIGVVGQAGVTLDDVSSYLRLLRFPSSLSNSLLQSLHIMMKLDTSVLKAYPLSVFNFGGQSSGIYVNHATYQFSRELQFFTWFRVETFDTSVQLLDSGHKERCVQHLFQLHSSSGKGWDIYFEDNFIAITLSYGTGVDPVFIKLDQQLKRGVWYHISMRHSKPPRFSVFARDEVVITLDHNRTFTDSAKFPISGEDIFRISCGKNFDGQMGPIYILKESISQAAIDVISKMDAGKSIDSHAALKDSKTSTNKSKTTADLMHVIHTADKKSILFLPKILAVYHPQRCYNGRVLDIHQSLHGKFGPKSCAWQINAVKDALDSLGGLPVLLPIIPRLFVENDNKRNEVILSTGSVGLGTSLGDIQDPFEVTSLLDFESQQFIDNEAQEQNVEGILSVLFSILAICLRSDKRNQHQIAAIGGFDMIEYGLRCLSHQLLIAEGETCVLSLISLRTAVDDNAELDTTILQRLLFNMDIWSKSSYKLQSSLMSVLMASIRAQTGYFVSIIGVQGVIDNMSANYMEPLLPETEDPQLGRPSISTQQDIDENPPVVVKTILEPIDTTIPQETISPTASPRRSTTPLPTPLPSRPSIANYKSFASTSFKIALNMELYDELGNEHDHRLDIEEIPEDDEEDSNSSTYRIDEDVSISDTSGYQSRSDMTAHTATITAILSSQNDEHTEDRLETRTLSKIDSNQRMSRSFVRRDGSLKSPNDRKSFLESAARKSFILMVSEKTAVEAIDAQTIDCDDQSTTLNPVDENVNDRSDDISEHEPETMTKQQRKHIRSCLQTMMTTLILHSPTEKEIRPILDFMATCKSSEVLHEMAQLLLCLIVEGGVGVMTAITTSCKGPEEFASFVIFHLIHQSSEDVRSMGIRLLTHYYVRLDILPTNVLTLALKRKKGSILSRTIDSLAVTMSSTGGYHSIHRLVACGGIALLIEIIISHSRYCTELTYNALLEMLVTKSGSRSQVTIKYTDLFQGTTTSADVVHEPVPRTTNGQVGGGNSMKEIGNEGNRSPTGMITSSGSFLIHAGSNSLANNGNVATLAVSIPTSGYEKGYLAHRSVVFSAHYLSPDQVHDEGTNMINSDLLPVFFEALPKIPLQFHDKIYNDLLALLKHSSGNREAFCGNTMWYVCMFEMVKQLVRASSSPKRIYDDTLENDFDGEAVRLCDLLPILQSWSTSSMPGHFSISQSRSISQSMNQLTDMSTDLRRSSHPRSHSYSSDKSIDPLQPLRIPDHDVPGYSAGCDAEVEASLDTKFSIGMKVFATLLLHCLEHKRGWKELAATISQSYKDELGVTAGQAIFSHMVNELSFSMRSKYRDLRRLAESTHSNDNLEAQDKLENLLSGILLTSQFSLLGLSCVTQGIPCLEHIIQRLIHGNSIQDPSQTTSRRVSDSSISQDHNLEQQPSMKRGGSSSKDKINECNSGSASVSNLASGEDSKRSSLSNILESGDDSPVRGSSQNIRGSTDTLDKNFIASSPFIDSIEEKLMLQLGKDRLTYTAIFQSIEESSVETNQASFAGPSSDMLNGLMLNFSHSWYDFAKGFSSFSPLVSPITGAEQDYSFESSSKKKPVSRKIDQIFARDSHLHPLERGHNKFKGRLILVLQTLRFFDTIFWPHESGAFRNGSMLKFYMEKVPGPTSMQSQNSSSSPKSTKIDGIPKVPDNLTLYSGVLRLCLYVLTKLSPLTDLASLNVLRMKSLVEAVDKVSTVTTPTDDWMLVILGHVTVTLQRVVHALEPLFDFLGLSPCYLSVPSLGIRDDSFEFAEKERIADDERKLENALNNPEVNNQIQNLFDNIAGRQLLQFIKNCLIILVSIHESRRSLLSANVEERTFYWFGLLIEKLSSDMSLIDIELQIASNAASQNANNDLGNSQKAKTTVRLKGQQGSPSKHLNGDSTPEGYEGPSSRRPRGSSVESVSETTSEISDKAHQMKFTRPGLVGGNYQSSSDLASTVDDSRIFARDVVSMLSWLREPYFRCNIFRSFGVARSLMSLEYYESVCDENYRQELEKIQQSIHESREKSRKVTEEVMELKEVSHLVFSMMKSREGVRVKSKRAMEALRLKQIASSWQECIHDLEADWSPWFNNEYNDRQSAGKAYYELARLKDLKMRRMILTRLPEPIDHSNAAYTEGKIRDQQLFEAQQQGSDSKPVGSTVDETSSFLNPEMYRMIADSKRIQTTWDDDDDNEVSDGNSDHDQMSSHPLNVRYPTTETVLTGSSNIATVIGGAKNLVMNPFFSNTNYERPLWSRAYHWEQDEKIQIILEGTQIMLQQTIKGTLLLTNKCLYFHPKVQTGGLGTGNGSLLDQRWYLDRLVELYGRRYLLQSCALEMFFFDTLEVFFAFKSVQEVKLFYRHLKRQHTPLLTSFRSLNPRHIIQSAPDWTELWRKRIISNFEYLMRLNIIAGRSYNDITQYPVFPWILTNYKSSSLDLNDPNSYRDLKKPIGALNPTRLQEFLDRYRSFDDDEVPRFMYGSHYSSAGVVLHYLIRHEPFTSMSINLQSGRFDCPDRIFFDLHRTWQGCNNSMSDVKELIPEFYCCPEMFLNSNRLNLGELQEGGVVDDVILPPWAKDAFDFVRIHREALESDYVSEHLNEWIDLIFGYKQTGQAAIEAHNVFYYLTYDNAVNIDAIKDPLQREATKAQVTHFGQTPSQLFVKEHPKRLPKRDCASTLCGDISQLKNIAVFTPSRQFGLSTDLSSVISIKCQGDRFAVVHSDLTVAYYRWNTFPDSDGAPFQIRPDRRRQFPSDCLSCSLGIIQKRHSSDRENDSALLTSQSSKMNRSTSHGDDGEATGRARVMSHSTSTPTLEGQSNEAMASQSLFMSIFRMRSNSNAPPSPSKEDAPHSPSRSRGKTNVALLALKEAIAYWDESTEGGQEDDDGIVLKTLENKHVALTMEDGGRVVSCGYWDLGLKVHALDSLKEVGSANHGHCGQITCVQVGDQGGLTVITGGDDGTCRVWILENPSLAMSYTEKKHREEGDSPSSETALQCVLVLWGHTSAITDLSYSVELDVVLSSSSTGLLCLHTVRQGTYLRSIKKTIGQDVNRVLVASSGYLLAHSKSTKQLHLFWINDQHLATRDLTSRVDAMSANAAGNVVVCGLNDGTISLRALWNLDELHVIDSLRGHGPVTSLHFSEDLQFLFIGSEDGTFSIATDYESRMKGLHSAIQRTPLLGSG